MKTNKANFRKKAESITTIPSDSAWKKLEEKLEKAPPKRKSIRLYPMLAIAASFILLLGFLLVNNVFSETKEENLNSASLVKAEISSVGLEQIAIVYKDDGPYLSFYETVAVARKGGILKNY